MPNSLLIAVLIAGLMPLTAAAEERGRQGRVEVFIGNGGGAQAPYYGDGRLCWECDGDFRRHTKEWEKERQKAWRERQKDMREAWKEAEKDRREAAREWEKAEREALREEQKAREEWHRERAKAEREWFKKRREN